MLQSEVDIKKEGDGIIEVKNCFDTSKMMLCPYDREEFGILFPSDVSRTLIALQCRNSFIRDFFV